MSTMTCKQKVKISVLVGVFSLVLLVFVLLFCEGLGTFVGQIVDRPVASSYIKKNYKGLEYKYVGSEIVNENRDVLGIDTPWKAYRFRYEVESYSGSLNDIKKGDCFYIEAYNFKVVSDGIYDTYCADRELVQMVNDTAAYELNSSDIVSSLGFVINDVRYDLNVNKNDFSGDINKKLEGLLEQEKIKNSKCIVHINGEKISFDEYRQKVSQFVSVFKNEKEWKPNFLQVVYYYGEGENPTMQFESQFEFYEIELDSKVLENAADVHYIVELDATQKTKAKIYSIVKYVYLIVVTLTVVVLSAFWVVKKVKKIKKSDVSNSENESVLITNEEYNRSKNDGNE